MVKTVTFNIQHKTTVHRQVQVKSGGVGRCRIGGNCLTCEPCKICPRTLRICPTHVRQFRIKLVWSSGVRVRARVVVKFVLVNHGHTRRSRSWWSVRNRPSIELYPKRAIVCGVSYRGAAA